MGLAGLVLAGGRSSRMGGGDKTLLPLAGRPLMSYVIQRLQAQLGMVAISANGDPNRFAGFDLPVLPDTVPGHAGPLAGVLAGLEWAVGTGASGLVTVAGDTPFFPTALVQRLAYVGGGTRIGVAQSCGRPHPVFALWPLALRSPLAAFLAAGEHRVMSFIERHDWIGVDFAPEAGLHGPFDPFFNINTPEDLRQAESMLGIDRT